jgi:hypothetical protein
VVSWLLLCTELLVLSWCSTLGRLKSSAKHIPSMDLSYAPERRRRHAMGVFFIIGDLICEMVCLRTVDSGDTVGQWHDLSEFVCDLAIDIKAGMVLGSYLMGQ